MNRTKGEIVGVAKFRVTEIGNSFGIMLKSQVNTITGPLRDQTVSIQGQWTQV